MFPKNMPTVKEGLEKNTFGNLEQRIKDIYLNSIRDTGKRKTPASININAEANRSVHKY